MSKPAHKARPEGGEAAAEDVLPSHAQIMLPLLRAVGEAGGRARAGEVIEAVGDSLGVPAEVRALTRPADRGRPVKLFARRVRWVRQSAVFRGLMTGERRGLWELSAAGDDHLKNCKPGVVVTIYESGGVCLWATAESASAVIRDNCVKLILTSPPYPLTASKDYGNLTGDEYLDWLTGLAGEWKRMLVDDGSLVLNLMDVWNEGEPTLSLYQERLLLRLVDTLQLKFCQRFHWQNPSKLPSSPWVTVRRVRVKNVIEHFYWLSKTANPDADNRRVLLEYSALMRRLLARGGETRRRRPGGHGHSKGAFGRDNGGMIPSNLFTVPSAGPHSHYYRFCRERGLPIHPARLPPELPEFFIKMLTKEGDLVYDPFHGSGRVAEAAEALGRPWVGSERSLAYISGSKACFPAYTNLAPHLCDI